MRAIIRFTNSKQKLSVIYLIKSSINSKANFNTKVKLTS